MLGFSPLASAPLASSGGDANLRQLALAATEAPDAVVINLDGSAFVLLNASEASDTAAITTSVIAALFMEASEAPDVAAFNAYSLEGYLAASETPDSAAMMIATVTYASMAAIETPDGISAPIIVLWTPPDQPDTDIWVRVNDGMPYNQTVI